MYLGLGVHCLWAGHRPGGQDTVSHPPLSLSPPTIGHLSLSVNTSLNLSSTSSTTSILTTRSVPRPQTMHTKSQVHHSLLRPPLPCRTTTPTSSPSPSS